MEKKIYNTPTVSYLSPDTSEYLENTVPTGMIITTVIADLAIATTNRVW